MQYTPMLSMRTMVKGPHLKILLSRGLVTRIEIRLARICTTSCVMVHLKVVPRKKKRKLCHFVRDFSHSTCHRSATSTYLSPIEPFIQSQTTNPNVVHAIISDQTMRVYDVTRLTRRHIDSDCLPALTAVRNVKPRSHPKAAETILTSAMWMSSGGGASVSKLMLSTQSCSDGAHKPRSGKLKDEGYTLQESDWKFAGIDL